MPIKPTTSGTSYSNTINTDINLLPTFDPTGNTDATTSFLNDALDGGAKFSYGYRSDTVKLNTNIQNPGSTRLANLGKSLAVGAASMLGNPITDNITNNLIGSVFGGVVNEKQQYTLASFDSISKYASTVPSAKYRDFRSIQGTGIGRIRLDGAAAAARSLLSGNIKGAIVAGAYAAASALPGGAYQLFNLETLYGWGNHGEGSMLNRLDFTTRSHVATEWKQGTPGKWRTTRNPVELATEFRGDKINVVEYSKRKLKNAYQWKPSTLPFGLNLDVLNDLDQTTDFIKFYFTGPKLNPGSKEKEDDIIVFRASLTSLTDSHNPNWTGKAMLGRADANYTYNSYSRDINVAFDIYATSRDEMKPIWRKLNALASYTAPDYSESNIAIKGPWMRVTIGDIFVQQPGFISTLQYTLTDSDTPWEINIEQDSTMMQAPQKISVTLSMTLVTNTLPQKNGIMYSLAKQFESGSGKPKQGSDNWLSDFSTGEQVFNDKQLQRQLKGEGVKTQGTAGPPDPNPEINNLKQVQVNDPLNKPQ